jgi:hypothetical protein
MARRKNTRRYNKSPAKRSLRFFQPVIGSVPRSKVTRNQVWRVKKTKSSRTEIISNKPIKVAKKKKIIIPALTASSNQHKICKRRHERNQIIHAIGKAGQKGQKRPNNKNRNIKC